MSLVISFLIKATISFSIFFDIPKGSRPIFFKPSRISLLAGVFFPINPPELDLYLACLPVTSIEYLILSAVTFTLAFIESNNLPVIVRLGLLVE